MGCLAPKCHQVTLSWSTKAQTYIQVRLVSAEVIGLSASVFDVKGPLGNLSFPVGDVIDMSPQWEFGIWDLLSSEVSMSVEAQFWESVSLGLRQTLLQESNLKPCGRAIKVIFKIRLVLSGLEIGRAVSKSIQKGTIVLYTVPRGSNLEFPSGQSALNETKVAGGSRAWMQKTIFIHHH